MRRARNSLELLFAHARQVPVVGAAFAYQIGQSHQQPTFPNFHKTPWFHRGSRTPAAELESPRDTKEKRRVLITQNNKIMARKLTDITFSYNNVSSREFFTCISISTHCQ